ncbi:MAG: hypothetical protein EOM77_02165 [Bacteroidia bacterium]|nr:hypothetical protein [Bacteroidia bacterium]
MKIKQTIKSRLMLNIIKSNNRRKPFDIAKADSYVLKEDGSLNFTDSHYFSGHNANGDSFFFRLAKRSNKTTEVWFTLKTSDGTILSNTIELYETESCPAKVSCVEIAKKINLSFRGEVARATKNDNDVISLSQQRFFVDAEATFLSTMSPFDFATGLDPHYVANALADEKWNKTFWTNLRINRQTHYEQAGQITLNIKIGDTFSRYDFPAMRDHSFGYRDWNYMNRHIWLMVLFDDGEIINLNMVNYPHMHNLLTGYRSKDDRHVSIRSITPLDELGTDGMIPSEIRLLIPQQGETHAQLIGKRDFVVDFSFDKGNYHILEGVGDYYFGSRHGRGIIEFGFNQDKKRWGKI